MSKGRSPRGRIERITTAQSAYSLELDEKDFRSIPKNQYPIVIAYNGRDHFTPTIPISEKEFLSWKVNKEFGSLLAATLLVAKELNRPGVPAAAAKGIRAIEKVVEDNLPKISKPSQAYYKTLMKKTSVHRGPPVQPAPDVPGGSGSSGRPSSSATLGADPVPEEEQQEEEPSTSAQGYKCEHCGVVKGRKPDLRGHLWSKHGLGEPIVCNMGDCDGRSFAHPSSLKQHQRTQHSGNFKFECEKCDYKTDSGSRTESVVTSSSSTTSIK